MVDDAELVATYGSPLYVYDVERVARAARDLFAALPRGARIVYSLKANPHPELVRVLRGEDCRVELTSLGELAAARVAGFPGSECLYGGPGKTRREIDAALAAGVRAFSVESLADLRRVGTAADAAGVRARCVVRINPGRSTGGAGLRMTGVPSQFGLDITAVDVSPADLVVPGATVTGFHFYPLTGAPDEETLLAELTGSIRLAAELAHRWRVEVTTLDLGGGFAAPYATDGERPVYHLREALETELDAHVPTWRGPGFELVFESGRYLVGDSGRLLCTVVDVKRSGGQTYTVLDTGVHHLGGLSGVGRLRPMTARPLFDGGEAVPTSLVGPLCTPADVVNRAAVLSTAPEPGRLLVIPNVGAYGLTASLLGFLSHPAPVEVLLRGGQVVHASRLRLARDEVAGSRAPAATPTRRSTRGRDDMPWDETYETVLCDVLPRLVRADGRLAPDAGLRAAGLDSLAMVDLLVRLEEAYAITIPDEVLTTEAFATAATLWAAVGARLTEAA